MPVGVTSFGDGRHGNMFGREISYHSAPLRDEVKRDYPESRDKDLRLMHHIDVKHAKGDSILSSQYVIVHAPHERDTQ